MKPFLISPAVATELIRENQRLLRLGSRKGLAGIAAAARIQTLAALKSAQRGWLGASFSCIDILTTLYHSGFISDPMAEITERSSLVLSKGHAAAGHYAVLNSLGIIHNDELLRYKRLDGLPAHSDRTIPGVDTDSGSLGQGLSKAVGIALAHRNRGQSHRVYAIIGDGELQEGQVFESLMTLKQLSVKNCVPIIDRNGLQSDSATREIKDADSWKKVFQGIGLDVVECNGHDFEEIYQTLTKIRRKRKPCVVIANTIKGGGSTLTAMGPNTSRREGIWHAAIPDDLTYLAIVLLLAKEIGNNELDQAIKEWRKENCPEVKPSHGAAVQAKRIGRVRNTMNGFSGALRKAVKKFPTVCVLDADLEKSCLLTEFALSHPSRFYEMGISEQDAVSTAAGLAIAGEIPIVCTFASFLKRSYDQIFAAAAEKLPVIFAGFYAGLDFFTDGKSHQSINDVAFMRSIPGIEVYEPLTPHEAEEMLFHLLKRMSREQRDKLPSAPAYVRLHREAADLIHLSETKFTPGRFCFIPGHPMHLRLEFEAIPEKLGGYKEGNHLLIAASPFMFQIAIEAQKILAERKIFLDIAGISSYFQADSEKITQDIASLEDLEEGHCHQMYDLKRILKTSGRIFSLESHLRDGGLADFIAKTCGISPIRIGARQLSGSALTLNEMLEYHQLNLSSVVGVIEKATGCRDGVAQRQRKLSAEI